MYSKCSVLFGCCKTLNEKAEILSLTIVDSFKHRNDQKNIWQTVKWFRQCRLLLLFAIYYCTVWHSIGKFHAFELGSIIL